MPLELSGVPLSARQVSCEHLTESQSSTLTHCDSLGGTNEIGEKQPSARLPRGTAPPSDGHKASKSSGTPNEGTPPIIP